MSEKIAVMGAGVMGAGIAQVLAIAGHEVVGYDISADVLAQAREGVDTGQFRCQSCILPPNPVRMRCGIQQPNVLSVETGEFGAMMDVELINDGPVTLWLER